MRERPASLYLQDISDSCAAIQGYVQGISFEQFEHERMRYSAVIREFEIIGEAVGNLPVQLKNSFPDVAWQDIKDFRNLLAHAYFGVDLRIVWNTIQSDLPLLLTTVQSILKSEHSQ